MSIQVGWNLNQKKTMLKFAPIINFIFTCSFCEIANSPRVLHMKIVMQPLGFLSLLTFVVQQWKGVQERKTRSNLGKREGETDMQQATKANTREFTSLTTPYLVYLTWLQLPNWLSVLSFELYQETITAYMNIWWTSRKTRSRQFLENLLNLNLHMNPSKTVTMMDALPGSDRTTFFTINGNATKGS